MESMKQLSVAQLVRIARLTEDPVQFGKDLLAFIGAELGAAVREEIAEREDRLKAMKRDTKVLSISFER